MTGKVLPMAKPDDDLADLNAFAKTRQRGGRQCWICSIPQVATVNAARGVRSASEIQAWLVEKKGYDRAMATMTRIEGHFARNHDRK